VCCDQNKQFLEYYRGCKTLHNNTRRIVNLALSSLHNPHVFHAKIREEFWGPTLSPFAFVRSQNPKLLQQDQVPPCYQKLSLRIPILLLPTSANKEPVDTEKVEKRGCGKEEQTVETVTTKFSRKEQKK
jgi:hypothetical protein